MVRSRASARWRGRQPNLIGYYSGWAQPFDTSFAETLHKHGVIPFVQIDPTDASVAAIAAGTYDAYLRSYADSVRNFRHAVVIGFGHEMNASWYSWGYKHVPAPTFVAAWRHIVTLFRNEGADNVTWLWTLEADADRHRADRLLVAGRAVCHLGRHRRLLLPLLRHLRPASSARPSLRCGPSPASRCCCPRQRSGQTATSSSKIQDLFHGMARYKTLGLVWFDKTQHGSIYHQDWRLEGNLQAEISFRLGVRDELKPYRPAS